jgi:hypothetical protein
MDYFAGLDISMDETHVCVLDREGVVVRESKTESSAQAVANELAKAPSCRRIVFETRCARRSSSMTSISRTRFGLSARRSPDRDMGRRRRVSIARRGADTCPPRSPAAVR